MAEASSRSVSSGTGVGDWTGRGTGKPGLSSVEQSFTLTLADQFIEIMTQEANPSGEVHEELGLIGFDQARSQYVLREFHVEGFVNQYLLEETTSDESKLRFVTESMENMPPGWRGRTTLEILSGDSFREIFELAGPGEGWTCYITIEFQRVK